MDGYSKAAIAAASLVAALVAYMGACTSAEATEYEVRYRNPGAAIAYGALEVCPAAGNCQIIPQDCGPGATCAAVADFPSGTNAEVWLVATAGDLRSDPSNRRTISVPAPEGCAWDSDGSGWVTPLDFGAFLRRFVAGEVNLVDFAAFMRVFGRACA